MSEMAKTAREAMKAKAKRLGSSGSTEKVDSSTFTPPELLNAQAKTGMRPVSRRTYKSGGKVQGECAPMRADRKPRKAGGKAAKADDTPMIDRKINRDVKKANEYRDGIKHIGGMKKGGRAGRAEGGGSMAQLQAILRDTDKRDNPNLKASRAGYDNARELDTMKYQSDFGEMPGAWKPEKIKRLRKGGRAGKQMGGGMGDDMMPPGAGAGMRTMRPENVRRPTYNEPAVDASIASSGRSGRKIGGKEAAMIKALLKGRTGRAGGGNIPMPPKRPPQAEIDAMETRMRPSRGRDNYDDQPQPRDTLDADQLIRLERGRNKGGRAKKFSGGDVLKFLSPIAMLAGMGDDDDKKKAHGGRAKKQMGGPMGDPRASGQAMLDGSATVGGVPKELLAFAPSMPSAGMKKHLGLKSGGKAKHSDEAMDKALIKKMVKPEARAKRQDGGGVFSGSGYPGKVPGVVPGGRMARKGGGRAGKNKGTNINIIISPGKGGGPGDMQAPMPNMPSMPSQGNPPMLPPGMPPMPPQMGGAPGMPPMPPRPPQGGPPPFKKGGRVYRSYKDMDAGSGSGLGRLEKSEIQSRR